MTGAYRLAVFHKQGNPTLGPACTTRDEALEPVREWLRLMRPTMFTKCGTVEIGPAEPPKHAVLVDLAELGSEPSALLLALQQDPALRAIYNLGRQS